MIYGFRRMLMFGVWLLDLSGIFIKWMYERYVLIKMFLCLCVYVCVCLWLSCDSLSLTLSQSSFSRPRVFFGFHATVEMPLSCGAKFRNPTDFLLIENDCLSITRKNNNCINFSKCLFRLTIIHYAYTHPLTANIATKINKKWT